MTVALIVVALVAFLLIIFLASAVKVAREYERGVVFRLGRLLPEPKAALVQIENFMVATSQIAQTTLRSVLGQHVLDELLSERDKINQILQSIIDEATSPWGIKVSIVEVKDVEIPSGMQRAMARQAEAERERRAKVISAEGEFQASERLKDAANVMAESPMALQLRYLQTLLEIGATNSTTIVFPAPIDIIKAFVERDSPPGQ